MCYPESHRSSLQCRSVPSAETCFRRVGRKLPFCFLAATAHLKHNTRCGQVHPNAMREGDDGSAIRFGVFGGGGGVRSRDTAEQQGTRCDTHRTRRAGDGNAIGKTPHAKQQTTPRCDASGVCGEWRVCGAVLVTSARTNTRHETPQHTRGRSGRAHARVVWRGESTNVWCVVAVCGVWMVWWGRKHEHAPTVVLHFAWARQRRVFR
jgi:hypothetical protein